MQAESYVRGTCADAMVTSVFSIDKFGERRTFTCTRGVFEIANQAEFRNEPCHARE